MDKANTNTRKSIVAKIVVGVGVKTKKRKIVSQI